MINITSDKFNIEDTKEKLKRLETTGQSYIVVYDRFEDYYENVYRHLKSINSSEANELRQLYLDYKATRNLSHNKQQEALEKIVEYISLHNELIK